MPLLLTKARHALRRVSVGLALRAESVSPENRSDLFEARLSIYRFFARYRARLILTTIAATASVLLAAPTRGVVCQPDAVPAATILVPYFEIGNGSDQTSSTLEARNTSTTPTLATVTLWTTWGVATSSFQVEIAGGSARNVNLGAVFREGRLPRLACGGQAQLTPWGRARLARLHAGRVAGNRFAAHSTGTPDGPVRPRGYVTVDVASRCSPLRPGKDGYFGPGDLGVAARRNVLLGTVRSRTAAGMVSSHPAVHVEAFDDAFGPGQATFYGSLIGNSGVDGREPLPVRYEVPFDLDQQATSELMVWRDIGRAHPTSPLQVDNGDASREPQWYRDSGRQGLRSSRVFLPDNGDAIEQVDPLPPFNCDFFGVICPPPGVTGLATQKVGFVVAATADANLYKIQSPISRGRLQASLHPELLELTIPPAPPLLQGWVGLSTLDGEGRAVVTPATPLVSGCSASQGTGLGDLLEVAALRRQVIGTREGREARTAQARDQDRKQQ